MLCEDILQVDILVEAFLDEDEVIGIALLILHPGTHGVAVLRHQLRQLLLVGALTLDVRHLHRQGLVG